MFQSFEEWKDDIAEYLKKGIDLWLREFAKDQPREILLHYRADGGEICAEVLTADAGELLEYGSYEWEEAHIFGEPGEDAVLSVWERERGYRVTEEVRDVIKDCGLGITTLCTEFYEDSGGGMQERMAEALAKDLTEAYGCPVRAVCREPAAG